MPAAGARLAFGSLWLAAVSVPLLALSVAAWISWREVEAEARARVRRGVDILHEHALRSFETQEALLAAIEARLAGMDWPAIATSEELHRFLLRLDDRTPFLAGFGLVDPDGRMVAASAPANFPMVPLDQRDRDYVRAHQQGGETGSHVGEQVVTRQSRQRLFTLSRPWRVPGDSGPPGVVVGAFSAESFGTFYASLAESPDDRIALVRLDGALLARHPPTPAPLRFGPDAPLMRSLREQPGPAGIFDAPSAVDGVARLNGFRQVGDYPVVVLYGIGPAALRAAFWQRFWPQIGIAASAMALLLGLTAFARAATAGEAAALAREAAGAETALAEAEARARVETRLRHAERSAALGQIAAGVAHDMGNLVQAVLASARALERRAELPEEVRRIAGLLDAAASRGQRVAGRLLTFGRPVAQPEASFDLAEALSGLDEMMGGLLGSGVHLEVRAAAGLPKVLADRAEFETVLLNLAVNARDAMDGAGVVRVDAEMASAVPEGAAPHPWVRVAVADSGVGMPEAVLQRAGEPFFTTKPPGKGTGLGLMMARQFAERAGGALTIASRVGEGTTVTLWLPAGRAAAGATEDGLQAV